MLSRSLCFRAAWMLLPVLPVLASAAWAGEGPVTLRVLPPIAARLAAMPRIVRPADAAEARVNAALGRLDRTVRKALAVSRNDPVHQAFWKRTAKVPMRDPRFLSLVLADDVDCSVQHPYASKMAVAYESMQSCGSPALCVEANDRLERTRRRCLRRILS